MKENKSIQILKSLNSEEIKEFGRFIDSPFFNRLNDVKRLYKILQKQYPVFPEEKTEYRFLFRQMFPLKQYNDARMRNLFSDLGQLTEKYLIYKSLEEENYLNDYLYLINLLRRKLFKLYEKHSVMLERKNKNESNVSGLIKYLNLTSKYNYYLEINKQHESGEIAYKKFDSLAEYFLLNLIKALHDFKVHKNMHAYENENSLMKAFAECFDFRKFHDILSAGKFGNSITDILFHLFYLFKGEEFEKNLKAILELTAAHESKLSQQLKYDIFLNLFNITAFKIYEEGLDYGKFRLNVIKEIISRKVYNHDVKTKTLPVILFITGINLTMELKDYKYFEHLKSNCLELLPKVFQKDAFNYFSAYYAFQKKHFSKSLDYLNNVDYGNIPFRKHVKNLTMLVYYELGYSDSAESFVNSYKMYLSRNNGFNGMYGEWYENFLKIYSKLIKLDKSDKNKIKNLRNQIRSIRKILFKSWFNEKLNHFK